MMAASRIPPATAATSLLQKWKKNEIFEAIKAVELNPRDFDLNDEQVEVRIKHKSSESYFLIGGDPSHYAGRYVVGDGPDWQFDAYSWQAVIPRIRRWLGEVKRDIETPDLWAELQREIELLLGANSVDVTENTRFTPDEQEEIALRLQEFSEFARRTYSLSEAQTRALDAKLDYLVDAARRLGRIDWRNVVAGVILGWLLAAALPPDSARDMFLQLFRALGHFCGFQELPVG
jgi:hypothetical protein